MVTPLRMGFLNLKAVIVFEHCTELLNREAELEHLTSPPKLPEMCHASVLMSAVCNEFGAAHARNVRG